MDSEVQLASGGLIAALIGAYYSFSQRRTGHAVATGAGAVAGGISGTLGTALTQACRLDRSRGGHDAASKLHSRSGRRSWASLRQATRRCPPGSEAMFDTAALAHQSSARPAAGGGIGALLGRFMFGERRRAVTSRRRASHA